MKRITIKSAPGRAQQASLQNSGYNMPLAFYGMWGRVIARHSEDHTVDLLTDRGFEVRRIPVASRDWVIASDPPGGGRDLPPEDTYVFMLMPTGQIESAFILCSAFPSTLKPIKDEFLVKDKEKEAFSRIEGGWQKTYDKSKGDITLEDDDEFQLTVKKSEKKTTIVDWHDNQIKVDADGVAIEDTNSNKATMDAAGTKIEDKNGNVITMDASGIVVKDKYGNEVDMKPTGTTIKSMNGKITGGTFQMAGTVAPTGSGPFCAISVCPFTGLPHTGSVVAGT